MDTEVLYVRIPLSLKNELAVLADAHGVSLSRVVSRAVAVYLAEIGIEVVEQVGQLP